MRRRLPFFIAVLLLGVMSPLAVAHAATESATVELEVEKRVEGDVPSTPEDYVFVLEGKGDAPMPSEDTVTVAGEGRSSFPEITFTEPKTYQYTVREVPGSSEDCTYDTSVYDVTVEVLTDDDGNLSTAVWAEKQGSDTKVSSIEFVNTYDSPETTLPPDAPLPPDDEWIIPGILPRTGDNGYGGGVVLAVGVVALVLAIALRRIRRGQQ